MLNFSAKQFEKVSLISNEGFKFEVDYDCAVQSGTIRMLVESSSGTYSIFDLSF